jgi:hypothetical protein
MSRGILERWCFLKSINSFKHLLIVVLCMQLPWFMQYLVDTYGVEEAVIDQVAHFYYPHYMHTYDITLGKTDALA